MSEIKVRRFSSADADFDGKLKALLAFDSNASKCIRNIPKSQLLLETDDSELSIKFIYNKKAPCDMQRAFLI